mmetsp:Transcript_25955/g.41808  ORF Transcript_25955/g.41808 Transcript_25955/m.41808 type:complete len:92 (-) Transcript_25955:22-297(-)
MVEQESISSNLRIHEELTQGIVSLKLLQVASVSSEMEDGHASLVSRVHINTTFKSLSNFFPLSLPGGIHYTRGALSPYTRDVSTHLSRFYA